MPAGPLDAVKLDLVDNMDTLEDFHHWVGTQHDNDTLGIDTETTGLNPYLGDHVRLIQIGDTMRGWAFPPGWHGAALQVLREYNGCWVAHNCFTGDTDIITRQGKRTLADLAGTETMIWTEKGWVTATVTAFGDAEVWEIDVVPALRSRTSIRHTIRVTANHRWMVNRGRRYNGHRRWLDDLLTTDQLQAGDRFPAQLPDYIPDETSDAFRHGLVFADGTVRGRLRDGTFSHQMRLCGVKARYASLWEGLITYPPSAGGDPVVNAWHFERNAKELPGPDVEGQYLADFIAGWAAFDGTDPSRTVGSRIVQTVNQEAAEWLRDNAASAGWAVTGYSARVQSGAGFQRMDGVPSTCFSITLTKDPTLLWTIRDVRRTGTVEPVYCPQVPEIERFTLAPGIYTCNSKFDMNFLRHNFPGQFVPPWDRLHDTMTLAHLEDPTRSRGLKPLSAMLVDPRAAESQQVLDKEMTKNDWTWATVPIVREGEGSSYWIYAALDPVLTCRMLTHFLPTLAAYPRAYELEMGTVRAIADMERRGAQVDLDYCSAKIAQIGEFSAQMRAWIREAHGIANATSLAQCIARFEELLGPEAITGRTKSGRKQLDKDQLELFVALGGSAGQLASALLELRRGEKFVGPYFKHFLTDVDEASRVHPTIWPVGTRTARMSVQHPALQTLPRKDPTVRDAFVPREGNVLVAIDADQIELRLATHLSRDEGLRAAFATGDDFFSVVASEAYRETITKADPRRQLMKNGIYATLYGAGIPRIAATAGVPVREMETVMAHFHERFPGIHRLQREIETVAKQRARTEGRPYVYTEAGRKMYGDAGREFALVNYAIQSSAAELLKQGICDCEAAGLGDYLILPVHDELVLDVPRGEKEDVLHTLTETLNGVGKDYLVPITWGADVMEDRWGTKYRKK